MSKIYCVEDDAGIRELISCALNSGGHNAFTFESSKKMYEVLEKNAPDLFLLDIMLPNESGFEILKTLKSSQKFSDIPVIMITAKVSELDKVMGLEAGADDYITKPFGVMELLSRIKAVMRRYKKPCEDIVFYKNIKINNLTREAFISDCPLELTFKEYELLKYLLQNEGIALSRDKLIEYIWGYDFAGESRTLDMHIKTLRQKLSQAGDCIETIRGHGYRLKREPKNEKDNT